MFAVVVAFVVFDTGFVDCSFCVCFAMFVLLTILCLVWCVCVCCCCRLVVVSFYKLGLCDCLVSAGFAV